MRVVAGMAGGIRLRAPRGRSVRPTTDRVKESLFASLGPVQGWVVADLFSGSGALGLEALSRGATDVLFVERDRSVLPVLRDNVSKVSHALGEQCGQVKILSLPVERLPKGLPEWAGRCDLILADPPYHPAKGAYGAVDMLQDERFGQWAGDALLVVEHPQDQPLPWRPLSTWQLLKQKRYGSTVVSFAQQNAATESDTA